MILTEDVCLKGDLIRLKRMIPVERRNKNTKFLFNESKMWNRKGVILLVIHFKKRMEIK